MPPLPADTRVARDSYDLLVIGGGVNGAGIARDAAGRGMSVLLCEQHDLAAHTSSASTKLIHGGLRYLEHGEFSLVRKALAERETLLSIAGHLIHPLDFVLPHDQHLRPAWMIRAGLFLYDHLARRRRLHASRAIDLRRHAAGAALQERFRRGFLYADARVDDARLVVVNARDALERGATVLARTRVVSVARVQELWRAKLALDGAVREVTARAGPTPLIASVDAVVDGPVENSPRQGITAGEMWMDVWIRIFLQIPGAYLLCWPSRERRNLLSPETGTGRGRLRQRGKDRETGNSGGFPAPVIG